MKCTAIIVDDEQDARDGISLLLQQDDSIHLLASCSDGLSAIDQVERHRPDILFLDIQMPEINGFEVLRSIQNQPKAVVFVTAYDEFAVRAFEVHAIDYLLKPYSDSRFFKALDHAKSQVKSERAASGNSALLSSLADQRLSEGELIEKTSDARLVVKDKGRIHLLLYDDIRWLEAYDYYVKIHLADSFHLIRESLKKLEVKLQPYGFIRIHKSSLVNIKYASSIDQLSSKEYILNLKEGEKLKVSRNYRKALFERLNLI